MARVLGLDLGDVRIGVALSDPSATIAQPYSTIENKGEKPYIYLLNLIRDEGVDTIVIGLPVELDGNEGIQAQKVRAFAKQLEARLQHAGLPANLSFIDERMTSVQAERMLAGSKRKDKGAIDRIAAALLLESYLQSRPK